MTGVPKISTHTPHTRCDFTYYFTKKTNKYFYSHTSYEVRLDEGIYNYNNLDFYSHTSYEVRRISPEQIEELQEFLLTHLIRGATFKINQIKFSGSFLLTHLIRGATYLPVYQCDELLFLLTHLIRGATFQFYQLSVYVQISTHTPHTRCDLV